MAEIQHAFSTLYFGAVITFQEWDDLQTRCVITSTVRST